MLAKLSHSDSEIEPEEAGEHHESPKVEKEVEEFTVDSPKKSPFLDKAELIRLKALELANADMRSVVSGGSRSCRRSTSNI